MKYVVVSAFNFSAIELQNGNVGFIRDVQSVPIHPPGSLHDRLRARWLNHSPIEIMIPTDFLDRGCNHDKHQFIVIRVIEHRANFRIVQDVRVAVLSR